MLGTKRRQLKVNATGDIEESKKAGEMKYKPKLHHDIQRISYVLAFIMFTFFLLRNLGQVSELVMDPVPLEARGRRTYEERRRCWDNNKNNDDGKSTVAKNVNEIIRHPPCAGLKTLEDMLDLAEFPCNYVHDGFYRKDSNVVLEQVYLTLTKMFDNYKEEDLSKVVPVFAEIGGHDGITKSISLSSSQCLRINTLLIEASPSNYAVLQKSRAYDTTVNAALCDGDFVDLTDHPINSGETKLIANDTNLAATARVACTTLDDEIDAMRRTLPGFGKEYTMALIFLVLDVEGSEEAAINGIQRYIPSKAMVETKLSVRSGTTVPIAKWATKHGLVGTAGPQDMLFNFDTTIKEENYPQNVFYGARKSIPKNTYKTSEVSPAYMYYGE